MQGGHSKFLIFPLTNVNLFPRTTKPLHIFESRYLETVEQSIQTQTPIAVCFVAEGSQEMRPVAGYAMPQVVESRPDGSLLIFMQGQGRVTLNLDSIQTDGMVSVMTGSSFAVQTVLADSCREPYVTLSEVLVRWVTRHISDRIQREVFVQSLTGPEEVVGAFAAYLIYDYDLQYEVMELADINEQVRFLYRLLESGKLTSA